MKLKQLGKNQNEIDFLNGTRVLFSYNDCVAACIQGVYYATSSPCSSTTNNHIDHWLGFNTDFEEKPQSFFDGLQNFNNEGEIN